MYFAEVKLEIASAALSLLVQRPTQGIVITV